MGGVSFPVVFYDGETETSIGNVVVYPSTEFKIFQSLLSNKIGISPHQFTVYLADRKSNPNAKFYRRVPITAKANFSAISRQTDCLFLVVLKRSRRDRRRNHGDTRGSKWVPPPNLTLLRRSDRYGYGIPEEVFAGLVTTSRDRERYLVNMGLNGLSLGPEEEEERVNNGGVVCEECLRAQDVGFHWCVYDAVTFAFRSPAGPIARPKSNQP